MSSPCDECQFAAALAAAQGSDQLAKGHMLLAQAYIENQRLRRVLRKARLRVSPDSELGLLLKT